MTGIASVLLFWSVTVMTTGKLVLMGTEMVVLVLITHESSEVTTIKLCEGSLIVQVNVSLSGLLRGSVTTCHEYQR